MEFDAWLKLLGALTPLLAATGALVAYLAKRKTQSAEGDGIIVDSAEKAVRLMESMMGRLERRIGELEQQLDAEKLARAADREECNKQLLALQQWGEQKEAEHCERTTQLEDKVNRLTEALVAERELREARDSELNEISISMGRDV